MENLPCHLGPLSRKDKAGFVASRWASAPVLNTAAHALGINGVGFVDSDHVLR